MRIRVFAPSTECRPSGSGAPPARNSRHARCMDGSPLRANRTPLGSLEEGARSKVAARSASVIACRSTVPLVGCTHGARMIRVLSCQRLATALSVCRFADSSRQRSYLRTR
jgi:hypothetical protein